MGITPNQKIFTSLPKYSSILLSLCQALNPVSFKPLTFFLKNGIVSPVGGLSERFKEPVLKTGDGAIHREFESHTLRHKSCKRTVLQDFSLSIVHNSSEIFISMSPLKSLKNKGGFSGVFMGYVIVIHQVFHFPGRDMQVLP